MGYITVMDALTAARIAGNAPGRGHLARAVLKSLVLKLAIGVQVSPTEMVFIRLILAFAEGATH